MNLSFIDAWVFDLDNTLYPPAANLFGQIDRRMNDYVARLLSCDIAEAHRIQKAYFHEHGTTLRGLMDAHRVDPRDFLDFVHDIDTSVLTHDRRIIEGIARLPGRKLVFTNGDVNYAGRVLCALGLEGSFEGVHDIHACDYLPKPDARAYQAFFDAWNVDPKTALFVEDTARNLRPAKALGMTTVWVNNGSERGGHEASADYIDIEIDDLGRWLDTLFRDLAA